MEHILELSSENDVVEKLFAEYEKKSIRKFIEDGGKIKVFPYVISLIFFTTKNITKPKLVYPGNNTIIQQIWLFAITFIFGWWSIRGIIWTFESLSIIGGGGYDVTALIYDNCLSESERAKKLNLRKTTQSIASN
jgi:hypothetical protein